jgi:hypothetical protein
LVSGDSLELNLDSEGNHCFRLVVTASNGQTYTNYSTLTVNQDQPQKEWEKKDTDPYWAKTFKPCGGVRSIEIQADIPFTGYLSGNQPLRGKAEYSIYKRMEDENNCGLATIRKPIIILDGFDPTDDRKAETLYGKYLRYLSVNGDPNSNEFLGRVIRNNPNQYDVIFLNFKKWVAPNGDTVYGGADYVERNAMVLVKLIQNINAVLLNNPNPEELVIIGPSMGGLISRYALAYMEKQKAANPGNSAWDHRCRLWISFDSPHLGANIAIGVQEFIRFFKDNGVLDAIKGYNKLESVAAQQMLLVHNKAGMNNSAPAPVFRTKFLANMAINGLPGSLGWPQNCRKISLINGSLNGTLFGENCAQMAKVEVFMQVKAWKLFNFVYRKVASPLRLAYGKINTIGANNPCISFDGYQKSGEQETRTTSNATQVGGQFGLDVTPGGYYTPFESSSGYGPLGINLSKLAYGLVGFSSPHLIPFVYAFDQTVGFDNVYGGNSFGLGLRTDQTISIPNFNFIPTKSALGFNWKGGPMTKLNEVLNNRNLYCTGEIPFDAYFGENFNSDHVSLTKKKVDWVMQEINANQPPPPQPTLSISGSNVVTYASGREYTAVAGPCPFPILYFWQIVEKSGIEASVSDITNQTCAVMTTEDGNGSKNGYFVLRLVASFNDPTTGETRCIGERILKIFVKNCGLTPFDPTCFFIRQNYSLKMCVGTPSVPPGVSFINHEFEVSRYPNSDFGNAIVNGGVTEFELITPNTNCPKLYCKINFAPAGQYLVYIRRRAKYQVVLPGETNPTIFYTNWSAGHPLNLVYRTSGTMCPGMIMMVVSPNPAIKGTDNAITVNTSNNQITLPTLAYIKDARGMVVDRFQVMALPFTRSISKLTPAEYTLFLDPAGENETKNFVVASSIDDKVIVSPNPVFKEVDENVTVKILSDSLGGDSAFVVLGENAQGLRQIEQEGEGKSFEVDVTGLQVGDYNVHVLGQANQFEGNSQLEVIGNLDLNLTPNPVTTNLSIELLNPVNPPASYHIKVTDKFGLVVKELDMTANPMVLPVDNLMPDIYYINISDGSQVMSKIFRKD